MKLFVRQVLVGGWGGAHGADSGPYRVTGQRTALALRDFGAWRGWAGRGWRGIAGDY
jgi:hypothetical protein